MARKTMIGLAAAAAVVLVTFSITGYPPIGQGTEGTIGQANRYQSAQPQLSASDVKLGETAVQEFLQSDVFDRLLKDENARKLLSDASVRAMLADTALTQSLRDQSVSRALRDDALRQLMSNDALSPASIAFWSSVRRCRMRRASGRGTLSMSR